jgi:DNA polymerase-4
MDAFYASVETRDDPSLAARPVIVGGGATTRGVVAAANYVVREYGVHSAMPTAVALRRCPHAVLIKPRMRYYASISKQILDIFHRYTPEVEPLSLDEAFLDVTESEALFGPADEVAARIKCNIGEELGLVASVGVAPNKFLAKLASEHGKPDGFTVISPGQEQDFLDPLAVSRLWGVGRVCKETLERLGITTVAELRNASAQTLKTRLGKHGEHLWKLAHGVDQRSVVSDRRAKSISHETTFATDIGDGMTLRLLTDALAEQVAFRLRRHGHKARKAHLKVRFGDFKTTSRTRSLSQATASTKELATAARSLLRDVLDSDPRPVRLLGVGVSEFHDNAPIQPHLFEQDTVRKQARIDVAVDEIKQRFGDGAVRRGIGFGN